MIKGKEGIALVLAVVFMLAMTILLTAVLLLSTQEINATQLYLDGNKALYYAEAGVEYAQARILNGNSVDEVNNSVSLLKDSFGKDNYGKDIIKSLSAEYLGNSTYKFTCEAQYNKAERKIVKKIELLYQGLWDKVLASEGKIEFGNIKGNLVINGNVHSNSDIIARGPDNDSNNNSNNNTTYVIHINGKVSAGNRVIDGDEDKNENNENEGRITALEEKENAPRLSFPEIKFDNYKARSKYVFNNEDDFVNALRNNEIVKDPSGPTFVYIIGDLHLRNLKGLNISDLCITVEGDIHVNNTSDMTIDGGSKLVTLISKNLKYNNDAKITFKNCIIYTEGNTDFTNMKADVTVENGAIYAKTGYIGFNNIKNTFTINGGNFTYPQVAHLFDIYEVRLWSDAGA